MMDFRLKYSTTLILLIPAWLFSQTNIDFGTVNEKSSSTKSLNYDATNFPTGSNDSVYAYFTLMGVGWFNDATSMVSKKGDTAGVTGQVDLEFKPKQNVVHNGVVLIENEYSVTEIVDLKGQGTFSNTYYSTIRNKSEEALKTALKTLLNNGAVSLGYNRARDNMYATIDNVNGEVECVYTGKKATFNTRAGANSSSFNCEHTYPQGFFSSSDPEKSDIHHLFPTTTTSNSRRGNDEFGTVSSASWQDGGSRSGGGKFEPRDVHKGAVARSMMYFVLRHGDFSSFLSKQESVLRTWNSQFAVSQKEIDRNDAIFGLQKNRSPFVDYPQLLERITKISGNSVAAAKYELQFSRNLRDTQFDTVFNMEIKAVIYNSGNQAVTITSIASSDNDNYLVVAEKYDGTVIQPGNYLEFKYNLSGTNDGGHMGLDHSLTIKTSAPNFATKVVNYKGVVNTGSSIAEQGLKRITAYPNPSSGSIQFEGLTLNESDLSIEVFDLVGSKVASQVLNSNQLDISEFKAGSYVAVISKNGEQLYQTRFIRE